MDLAFRPSIWIPIRRLAIYLAIVLARLIVLLGTSLPSGIIFRPSSCDLMTQSARFATSYQGSWLGLEEWWDEGVV